MARRKRSTPSARNPFLLEESDAGEQSLLDVVDRVLNKGAVLNGDLVLGVANVDLIYARLSVLLTAIDKVTREPVFTPIAAAGPPLARRAAARSRRSPGGGGSAGEGGRRKRRRRRR